MNEKLFLRLATFNVNLHNFFGVLMFEINHTTSFTDAKFIKDESKLTLRDALLILSSKLRNNIQHTSIRVDSHSSFKSLKNDEGVLKENWN